MKDTKKIFELVRACDDIAELRSINALIISRLQDLNRNAAFEFRVGDKVKFRNKYGFTVTGTIARRVQSRNGKFDLKDCSDGLLWRVNAANLERAS